MNLNGLFLTENERENGVYMTDKTNIVADKDNKESINMWMKKYWFYILLIILIVVFFCFRDYLKENNESITIIITTIYVIATIKISNANIESAEATRAQLAKSIEQYDDSKHLQIIPFLQASISKQMEYAYCIELLCDQEKREIKEDNITICIENIGKGSANNITYTWEYEKVNAEGKLGMVGIPEGEKDDIKIYFLGNINKTSRGSLMLHYTDLLGKKYIQKNTIDFSVEDSKNTKIKIWTDVPVAE